MTLHLEAVYFDGVLRPKEPLSLPNGTAVRIAVETATNAPRDAQATLERLRAFRGMLKGISRQQLLDDRRQGLP